MMRRFLLLAVLLLAPLAAHAVKPDEMLPDPALEARARGLSAQLRCMVCQNESIDDSDAALARDLRLLVRERLKAGDSDQQVRDFLTARYGDFILLKPPLEWRTLALWGAPFAILVVGAAGLLVTQRRRAAAPAALSADEERRLRALLDER
jgi:cytochrome c-type biogenesis protein CcmH